MDGSTVFMFPGQGSQYVGMYRRLARHLSAGRRMVEEAEDTLKIALGKLMDDGPADRLTRTSNAQPALLVMGTACARELERRGYGADMVMGHSLGEYTALVHAGVFGIVDGLRLVRTRGLLMEEAVRNSPGKMAAVIGMDRRHLEEIVAEHSRSAVLAISNFNSPTQMVLSGDAAAVQSAKDHIDKSRRGKAVLLDVSAPFHCSLMQPMAREFAESLKGVPFTAPTKTFIDNATGLQENDPEKIRQKLLTQLTSPVLWEKGVRSAFEAGATRFVESGPRRVLTALVKRTIRQATLLNSEDILGSSETQKA